MKVTLIFLAVICFCFAVQDSKWEEFKNTYKKNYKDAEEEKYRRGIYEENMKKIEEHNKKYENKEVTWFMAVNNFTDMTSEEVLKLHTGLNLDHLLHKNETELNNNKNETDHEEHKHEEKKEEKKDEKKGKNDASMVMLSTVIVILSTIFAIILS